MAYTIEELIDDRNRQLYNEIVRQIPIILQKSDDDGWGAFIKDGRGIIYHAASGYPISCFTHELLHLSFTLRGTGMPGFMIRSGLDPLLQQEIYNQVKPLHPYVYDQLIHHKIFVEFIKMGFAREEFLTESDKLEANNCAMRDLPKMKAHRKETKRDIPCKAFIYPLLFLRSPHDPDPQSQRLLKDLRNISDSSFYRVDAIIKEIQKDANPDMRKYLGRIFFLCDQPDVGFGYSENDIIWASDSAKQ